MTGSGADGAPMDASWLESEGLLAARDAVVGAEQWQAMSLVGPERVLRTHVMRGLDLDLVESRGFDVGAAHFRGVPISWRSPVPDSRALDSPRGLDWVSRFNGGLVTTCGLHNIGPAKGDEGLHGDFSHRPAQRVAWRTWVEPDEIGVEAVAVVQDVRLLGPSLTVHRTVTSTAVPGGSAGRLRIVDAVENVGTVPADLAILYHVNLGAPLVAPGTRIDTGGTTWRMREPNTLASDPAVMPDVTDVLTEAVFEHTGLEADPEGYAGVLVRNEAIGLSVRVRWSLGTLPRLYQWILPTRGRWALGIEPANAALFGVDDAGFAESTDRLEPGDTRTNELIVDVDLVE